MEKKVANLIMRLCSKCKKYNIEADLICISKNCEDLERLCCSNCLIKGAHAKHGNMLLEEFFRIVSDLILNESNIEKVEKQIV